MAELRVERKPRNSHWWVWALLAIAAALLLLALFGWLGRTDQVGLYEPTEPAAAITYQGETWIPAGDPVRFPEEQMVAVGTTDQGYTLFANREQGYQGGGGGGEISPQTEPKAWGRVYLKATDGQYIPLFQESGLKD